jgi:hypothetical protein
LLPPSSRKKPSGPRSYGAPTCVNSHGVLIEITGQAVKIYIGRASAFTTSRARPSLCPGSKAPRRRCAVWLTRRIAGSATMTVPVGRAHHMTILLKPPRARCTGFSQGRAAPTPHQAPGFISCSKDMPISRRADPLAPPTVAFGGRERIPSVLSQRFSRLRPALLIGRASHEAPI